MKADSNNPFENSQYNSAFHDDRVMDSMLSKMIQSDSDRQQFVKACMQKISGLDSNEELRILGDRDAIDSYADTRQMQAEAVQLMGLAAVLLVGCFMYSMFLALKTPERVYTANTISNVGVEAEQSLVAVLVRRGNGTGGYTDEVPIQLNEFGEAKHGGFNGPVVEYDLERAIGESNNRDERLDLLKSANDKLAPEVVEALFAEETIPRRHLNIDLKFSRTGRASIALNDDVIGRNLRAFEAQNVLAKFVPELQQRSSFLGPRLGTVFGAIVIDEQASRREFGFESISQIKKAFQDVSLTLAKFSSSHNAETIRSRVAFSSMVQKTNDLFQGWAQDAIESGVCETPMYQDSAEKYSRVIGRKQFEWFAANGQFEVDPGQLYMAETTIQHLASGSLQNQLARRTQELSLFKDPGEFNAFKNVHALPINLNERFESKRVVQPIHQLVAGRPDLLGLPMVMGKECHLNRERADSLDLVSRELGPAMSMSLAARNQQHINQINNQQLHVVANRLPDYTGDSQKLMTVDQMVQHESPKLKHDFIAKLGQERSQVNANLLACYAKFDLDSGVRMAATRALASYEPEMYRKRLLDGFFYPWDVVAQHSAEALVRLNDTGAIGPLVELLLAPHPGQPYKNSEGEYVRRELVAVNHMKNCVLCHGVSYSPSDPGRAVVPEWTRPIARNYYSPEPEIRGLVARADITYLRQDFSVVQPVKDHGHWPANQRFDYLVRESPYVNGNPAATAIGNPEIFREAVVFALKMLTDKSPATDNYDAWKEIVDEIESLAP